MHIRADQLPVLPEGALLCEAFGLDPLGTIASGALLAAVPAVQAALAIDACAAAGMACYRIGTAVANHTEVVLYTETTSQPLPTFARDEIVQLFQG